MTDSDSLAEGFDALRAHLRAVAYRMLGSTGEAEDAVQEAWLRLNRADAGEVEDLRAWLTTVVARVSLDMLRSRRSRREESLGPHLPEPIVTVDDGGDPEYELLLADSMGLALLVVLETLSPAERLAFVLHDIFAVPFDEIASIVDRSPDAARQLASRGRRRIRDAAPDADPDRAGQREVVDAFLVAAREGDFEALLGILDPDVVFRVDRGPDSELTGVLHGAEQVARRALGFNRLAPAARRVLVNGAPGFLVIQRGQPFAVASLTVSGGRVAEVNLLADPARLRELDLPEFDS